MAKSAEYPDLEWVPPRSWTNANRTSVQLIVIHTTEGSFHTQSAEDGAAYDQRRTDGTSTHYFHDSNSTVQCVHTADQAHTARAQGNRRGIQHELCARAAWGDAQWGGAYGQAVLKRAAKQAARDAKKWGIPGRKLTPAQVAAGTKGFCGHVDITRAFPQDNGSHTDPGAGFPWTIFLAMVNAEMGAKPVPANPKPYNMVTFDAHLPLLSRGDSDTGTTWITRAQKLLNVTADGDYGPNTARALAERMSTVPGRTTTNGSKIGVPEWRVLYGLWENLPG